MAGVNGVAVAEEMPRRGGSVRPAVGRRAGQYPVIWPGDVWTSCGCLGVSTGCGQPGLACEGVVDGVDDSDAVVACGNEVGLAYA
jgi:hypothetical protein